MLHVNIWGALLCYNLRWWMQKRSLGSNGPPGRCFNLQCWVNTKALDWEEPFWSQLAGPEQARIFWAQGHCCMAARASLSEKHQHQPRNKCHFFPFLFLLFPDPLAQLTCPPDLITGCERRSSVWLLFPKGKMTYFSQWETRFQKGRVTAWQGRPWDQQSLWDLPTNN